MKNLKRIVASVLALVMMMSICLTSISVSAANVCYNVRGDLTQSVTFEAEVGKKIFSSEKIVLTQNKGKTRQSWNWKEKKVDLYGCFYVSVYDNTEGKWVYENKKWQDGKFTIKSSSLKKKHKYIITVTGKTTKNIFDGYDAIPYVFEEWLSYPTWSATKTGGNIKFCG